MHMNILKSASIVVAFLMGGVTAAQSIQTQTIEWTVRQGFGPAAVPLRASAVQTVADIARVTNTRVVYWRDENGGHTYLPSAEGDAPGRIRVRGNIAYFLSVPRTVTVTLTGTPWPARDLVITRSREMPVVINVRPDQESDVREFADSARLLGVVRSDVVSGSLRWLLEYARGLPVSHSRRLMSTAPFGLLFGSTVGGPVVLPNTNRAPIAGAISMPQAVSASSPIPLVSAATDPDDLFHDLEHHWIVSDSKGRSVETSGADVAIAFGAIGETVSVNVATSDGVASGSLSQPIKVSVVRGSWWVPDHDELFYGTRGGELRAVGLIGILPDVSRFYRDSPMLTDSITFGYQIRQDRRQAKHADLGNGSVALGRWREIDLSSMWPVADGYRDEYGVFQGLPRDLLIGVDAGLVTTVEPDAIDVLVERSIGTNSYTTDIHYFISSNHYSIDPVDEPSLKSKGIIGRMHQWVRGKIGAFRKRFLPVSVVNRFSNRVGYDLVSVNPDNDPSGKVAVVLVHGYDFRSEFCVLGKTWVERQQEWPLLGTEANGPAGVAENIHDLERQYAFYRAVYPTTRSLPEIAEGLRALVEERIFSDGRNPRIIFMGYSMGGLVCRYLMNKEIRGEPIGNSVDWLITLSAPHHGTLIAGLLGGGFWENDLAMSNYVPRPLWPFYDYGCVPGSKGLRSLVADDKITLRVSVSGFPGERIPVLRNYNRQLAAFNASEDRYRESTNVILIAGGTTSAPLVTTRLEMARQKFDPSVEYGFGEKQEASYSGFSDGLVGTRSSIPSDLFGENKGSADEFFGRRVDGTYDRAAYFDGLNHEQIYRNYEVIARLHTFLLTEADRENHPPELTGGVLVVAGNMPSLPQDKAMRIPIRSSSGGALAADPDGDALRHHWKVAAIFPSVPVTLEETQSAFPTIITSQPTNVVLWHTVRDDRGGIAVTQRHLFLPEDGPALLECNTSIKRVLLLLGFDDFVNGPVVKIQLFIDGIGEGCGPQPHELWLDPSDSSARRGYRYEHETVGRSRWWYFNRPIWVDTEPTQGLDGRTVFFPLRRGEKVQKDIILP